MWLLQSGLTVHVQYLIFAECRIDICSHFLKQTNSSAKEEVKEKQSSSSWWGLLKYSLLLFVPGFLNHAALYREGDVLRPSGQYYSFNPLHFN